ncbi:unnamed protein product [Chrysoparadoxa australica]
MAATVMFAVKVALITLLGSTATSQYADCGIPCPQGGCVYNKCKEAVTCPGGSCTFIDCSEAHCGGGACKFEQYIGGTCNGGACEINNPTTTLKDGYCTGGVCTVNGRAFPSRLTRHLTY